MPPLTELFTLYVLRLWPSSEYLISLATFSTPPLCNFERNPPRRCLTYQSTTCRKHTPAHIALPLSIQLCSPHRWNRAHAIRSRSVSDRYRSATHVYSEQHAWRCTHCMSRQQHHSITASQRTEGHDFSSSCPFLKTTYTTWLPRTTFEAHMYGVGFVEPIARISGFHPILTYVQYIHTHSNRMNEAQYRPLDCCTRTVEESYLTTTWSL